MGNKVPKQIRKWFLPFCFKIEENWQYVTSVVQILKVNYVNNHEVLMVQCFVFYAFTKMKDVDEAELKKPCLRV